MSTLHTISRSPASALLGACMQLLQEGDAVLFLEDGTYYCTAPGSLAHLAPGIAVYALKEDMLARGLLGQQAQAVSIADYDEFVSLCCEFDKVISWF